MKRQGRPASSAPTCTAAAWAKRCASRPRAQRCRRAALTLSLNVCGVDLLRSKNGPLVLEVNSSPGIEGLEKATGVDVAGLDRVPRCRASWQHPNQGRG
jgi:ribosomal protein S6--L-glutamate ligase